MLPLLKKKEPKREEEVENAQIDYNRALRDKHSTFILVEVWSVNMRLKFKRCNVSSFCGHRCILYLRRQPPHGFFLASPHLRGPGTAASSQGAVRGLGLGQREPLSIWTGDSRTHSGTARTRVTFMLSLYTVLLRKKDQTKIVQTSLKSYLTLTILSTFPKTKIFSTKKRLDA